MLHLALLNVTNGVTCYNVQSLLVVITAWLNASVVLTVDVVFA